MSSHPSPLLRSARLPRAMIGVVAVMLTVLALLLSRSSTGAAQPVPLPVEPLVALPTDQIIVRFRSSSDQGLQSAAAEAQLAERLSDAAGVPLTILRPMSGDATVLKLAERTDEATVLMISQRLAALPEVEYAEPDAIMQLIRSPRLADGPQHADLTPDDTRFDDQWHYRYQAGVEEGLNLVPAWNITTGSANTVVAVIDTGIRPHVDLAERTVPGYDFIWDPYISNDGDGRDDNPADPGDWVSSGYCGTGTPSESSSWHGTHVAGTIAANSNNDSGVAGINWAARILPLRVLGRCGGYLSDIVDAMRWAAGLSVLNVPANANPADVINLSLAGYGPCGATYQNAFNELTAAGVVSVVAAGNSDEDAINTRPANCSGIITVAATSKTGDQTYYTNYGSTVEIAAPGGEQSYANDPGGVLSTLNTGTTTPGSDNYVYYQGTSMAAPHVAGLVSLLLGKDPKLTPAQVLNVLQLTARDFPNSSSCTTSKCGAGIADAFAALSALDAELVAPVLTAPANGAVLATREVALRWSGVVGASAYQVQVATDAGFGTLVVDLPSVALTTTTVTMPGEGDFWWRVRAKDGADTGPWSTVWQFTVDYTPCTTPAAPNLIHPSNYSESNFAMVDLMWFPVTNVTGYDVQISLQSDVSAPLVNQSLPVTSFYYAQLEGGQTYYWRVRATHTGDGCNEIGPWSQIWRFSISSIACSTPGTPVLLLPENHGTNQSQRPTFVWEPAPHATHYEFRVGLDANFDTMIASVQVTDTEYTPDLTLEDGRTYYWKVRSYNGLGTCNKPGLPSEGWSFTVGEETADIFRITLPAILRR